MKRRLRFRYVLPLAHAALFLAGCILYLSTNEGLMNGKNDWFFGPLWVADMPISIFCFVFLWGGPTVLGLILWGVLGTAWWFLIGFLLERVFGNRPRTNP